MAITKETIFTKLLALLRTITIANGYLTNVGNNVAESRTVPYKPEELPAINLNEIDDTKDAEAILGSYHIHENRLQIEIDLITLGTLTPTELRKAEADVLKAIGSDQTLTGSIIEVDLEGVTSSYSEHEEYKVMGKTITIIIKYRVKAWQSE